MRPIQVAQTFFISAGILLSSQVQSQVFRVDGAKGPHPWPMRHADKARTNRTDAIGPTQGVLAWKVRTAGLVPGMATNRAGQVILGTYYEDQAWSSTNAFGILNSDGSWEVKKMVIPYVWGAAQGADSWPAIDKFSTIRFNSTNGEIVKYSPSGNLLQTIIVEPNATNNSSVALGDDGSFYHYQITALTKYNSAGSVIWSTGAGSQSSVAVAPNGDCVLGGVRTNEPHGSVDITYFNANGTVRWQKTSTNGKNFQATIGPDGTVYHGNVTFNPDGTIKWSGVLGSNRTVTLGRNNRLYGYSGAVVRCVDATTGAQIWSTNLPAGSNAAPGAALDGDNKLFVTTTNGTVHKLDGVTGALEFSLQLALQLGSPVIGADNSLYVSGIEDQFGFETFVYKVK